MLIYLVLPGKTVTTKVFSIVTEYSTEVFLSDLYWVTLMMHDLTQVMNCNLLYRKAKYNVFGPISHCFFFFTGICSLATCSLYAHRITSEFFDPLFVAQK